MLSGELSDEYLELVEAHLEELKLDRGVLLSARLSAGNKGAGYTLRRQREQGWLERLLDRSGYSFTIHERDEGGFRALSALEDRGMSRAADALAQAVEHVLGFFRSLAREIGFYLGCVNLSERLAAKDEPIAIPTPLPPSRIALAAQGLYDVCLALTVDGRVVGNDLEADMKSLI